MPCPSLYCVNVTWYYNVALLDSAHKRMRVSDTDTTLKMEQDKPRQKPQHGIQEQKKIAYINDSVLAYIIMIIQNVIQITIHQ